MNVRSLFRCGVLVAFALATLPGALAQERAAEPPAEAPGAVRFHQKISDTAGNFTGTLGDFDYFGSAVASIGDLDGDGVTDLAVGATGDDDGGDGFGAVWVLFLNTNGTVRTHQKISATEGGFTGVLDPYDEFGSAVTALGDLDGDGVTDLVVGAPGDDDGGFAQGAVWVLFMNTDGTVRAHQKISATEGGFTGTLGADLFGTAVAALGDLNGDGVADLAVGAPWDDDGGGLDPDRGAVWVLFLNADGTVASHQKISATAGGFTGTLDVGDNFGTAASPLGDFDGDGVTDLVVGAPGDGDAGYAQGAVWVLFMNADGTVRAHQKISGTQGGFLGTLDGGDFFGTSVTAVDDLNGDDVPDLAVGAPGDGDGGAEWGALYVLFMRSNGTVRAHQKISATEGGFTGALDGPDRFGSSVTSVGDLNDDGVADLAVGALADNDGGSARGATWVLFLDGVVPPLTVTATPTAGFPVPAEGGPLTFTVQVRNNTGSLVGFDLWVIAEHGTSNFSRRFSLLSGRVLGPYQTKTFVRVQNVPGNAPAGVYDVAVYAGRAPYDPVAVDHFPVTKLTSAAPAPPALRGAAGGDWDGTWIEVEDAEGSAVEASVVEGTEDRVQLVGAAPNPFQGRTTLAFTLPSAAPVRLAVYDVLGREVAVLLDEAREAGPHAVGFDAAGLPAGAYLVRLDAGGAIQTQRVTVVR